MAASLLPIIPVSINTVYADDATPAAAPSITRQPSASTYAKGASAQFYVNASSIDGGYLSYQWYMSARYASPLATNVDGTLTAASKTTIYNSRSTINGATQSTLATTTPGTAGYYYYWVEITNNNDANDDGVITGTEKSAPRESAYALTKVVDRTLEDHLINGDFSSVVAPAGKSIAWDSVTKSPVNGVDGQPNIAWGVHPISRIPGWDTTHNSAQAAYRGKQIEIQNLANTARQASTAQAHDLTGHGPNGTTASPYYYAELAAADYASIYQDISTVPGKIYEWSLQHTALRADNTPDVMAVVIGSAINDAGEYGIGVTNRYLANQSFVDGGSAYLNEALGPYDYPYGMHAAYTDASSNPTYTQSSSYFYDILQALSGRLGSSNNPAAYFADKGGQSYTQDYNGHTYYVYICSSDKSKWWDYSGVYSVPAGQGVTTFGFVGIQSSSSNGGNLLDNIIFASGSDLAKNENISYVGETTLSAATKAGYAYALAEVRGSTVISLSGLNTTFNGTATSPNASLGTGSWYTPGAGTLTFSNLTPGKNYRIIGIPIEAISVGLGTNLSPADVLDNGYYQEAIMLAASAGTSTTLPAVTYEYDGIPANKVTASLVNAKTDVEYALLAYSGGNPVTGGPALPTTAWTPGTVGSLEFRGLDPDTYYYLVARPVGYTEVTYAQAAFNTDGSLTALLLKTPASTAKDLAPPEITPEEDGTAVTVTTKSGYTYRLVDPATGEFVGDALSGIGGEQTFTSLAPGTIYQVVAQLNGDSAWMRGVRVYPYPEALKIDYENETISDTGTATGVAPADIEYGIRLNDGPTWLAGDGDTDWLPGTGTSNIDLGVNAVGTNTSILDSLSSPGDKAVLFYRQAGGEGDYTGAALHPSRTLDIPPRPLAPTSPTDYFIDYPGEEVKAQSGTIQLAPQGSTAWTDIAGSSSEGFAEVGWSGTADYSVDLRLKSVTDTSFASRVATDTIVKRPPAPTFTAVFDATYNTLEVTMTGYVPGTAYQVRHNGDWGPAQLDSNGTSDKWPYSVTDNDYQVRLAATADAPASNIATVSAPLVVDTVDMGSFPYGDPIDSSKSKTVTIRNISNVAVPDVELTLGGPDAEKFTLTQGSNPFEVPISGTHTDFVVTPIEGLDAGTYNALLLASYDISNGVATVHKVTTADVVLTVDKIPWDIADLDLSTSGATDDNLTLDIAGAPSTSKLDYHAGSAAWNDPSAALVVAEDGSAATTFDGLSAASTYTLSVRVEQDSNHYESAVVQIPGYTAYATPVWDDVLSVDYHNEVLHFKDGFNPADYEVCIDGTIIDNPDQYSLTSYADGADFTISVAHKAGADPTPPYPASGTVSKTVAARSSSPTGTTVTNASSAVANNGAVNLDGTFEYRAHREGSVAGGWSTTVNTVAVTYGDYDVRRPATDSAFASESVTAKVGITGVSFVTYAAGDGIGVQTQTGGTAGDANAFYDGTAVEVLGPGTMSRAGYVFAGWTVSPAVNFAGIPGTTTIPAADTGVGKTFLITADTTLTARWEMDPNRSITKVEQYGGTDGKVRSTGILVTFSEAVTAPPADAFTVGGLDVTGVTTVSDGGDSDAATWVIGVEGTWVNGASDITVSVANWDAFVVTTPGAQSVAAMYAPEKKPTPTVVIDFGETYEGYAAPSELNVQDTLNSYFTDDEDKITVTNVTFGAGAPGNPSFALGGSGASTTVVPKEGLAPGIYDVELSVAGSSFSGADTTLSPRVRFIVYGWTAFDAVAVNGASTGDPAIDYASDTLTVTFVNPIPGLTIDSFTLGGGAAVKDTSRLSDFEDVDGEGLTYEIPIKPAHQAVKDGERMTVTLTIPDDVAGAGGMTDAYENQRTTLGITAITSQDVAIAVPRSVDTSETFAYTLGGHSTSFIQFRLLKTPYYPLLGLEGTIDEIGIVGVGGAGVEGAADVDRVVRVDASFDSAWGWYSTYNVYLSNVQAGTVGIEFANFAVWHADELVYTLVEGAGGASAGSRNYFLETYSGSAVNPPAYQTIPTIADTGAQGPIAVVAATGATEAPRTELLTSLDLVSGETVQAVLLDGVALDAGLWSVSVAAATSYSYHDGAPIQLSRPLMLTLAAGFTNTNGPHTIEVISAPNSNYLYGLLQVSGITDTYDIALSQAGTFIFDEQKVGYAAHTPLSLDVRNTGNQDTGPLTIALSGAGATNFTLSGTSLASIPNGSGTTGAFTVRPHTGLARGLYQAVVTVSGEHGISRQFDVRFAVQNSAPVVTPGNSTQTGTARPASGGGAIAADSYSAVVSSWFADADGDALSYAIIAQDATGDVSFDDASETLTFTPVIADAGFDRTITLRAYDNSEGSTSDVVITVHVGAAPPYTTSLPTAGDPRALQMLAAAALFTLSGLLLLCLPRTRRKQHTETGS